ncbi:M1-specific T cell receptor beta chain-like [Sphaeramia orbicularis]|uniref:M1-specific T cell receptor beta chain-like n=1 Tax=Sphaeramia orbicularis TaxID=375764 RepID=UPI0011817606|nr:M1-specific T cell receptor beta chain-like [Sphaeramia orbicularis]
MLLLPPAALCCLCSALVATATQLIQEDVTLTRRVGQNVSFSCRGTEECYGGYTLWYQKKDTETFKPILYIYRNSGSIYKYNHPQKADFSSVDKGKGYELQIQTVGPSHSASYYCACWKSDRYVWIFGSGTKLYVTDDPVLKPVVGVYPAASTAPDGKTSLMCVASGMSPPEVRFSWKRQKDHGTEEDLPDAQGEQLEVQESGRRTSIRTIHQNHNSSDKYWCTVQHEGGTTHQEVPASASCPPQRRSADPPALHKPQQKISRRLLMDSAVSFQVQTRLKLLCGLYTVLIVKSLVYCCGLCLLMSL